ncbi:MAG: hypothetical protein IJU41_03505 [Clostridia bacterium]|nr:hypothetical protein [Clostridia bacterium]
MTNSEICASYRDAKFKKKQVEILAELNDCGKKEIIKILSDGGFTAQQLPMERGAACDAVLELNRIETEVVISALCELLHTREAEKEKIEKQVEALNILIDKCYISAGEGKL